MICTVPLIETCRCLLPFYYYYIFSEVLLQHRRQTAMVSLYVLFSFALYLGMVSNVYADKFQVPNSSRETRARMLKKGNKKTKPVVSKPRIPSVGMPSNRPIRMPSEQPFRACQESCVSDASMFHNFFSPIIENGITQDFTLEICNFNPRVAIAAVASIEALYNNNGFKVTINSCVGNNLIEFTKQPDDGTTLVSSPMPLVVYG
jgi:hypothetical protein